MKANPEEVDFPNSLVPTIELVRDEEDVFVEVIGSDHSGAGMEQSPIFGFPYRRRWIE